MRAASSTSASTTGIVKKSGAWYTYDGDQLGQGKENARNFLLQNPDIAADIEKKILVKLGIGAGGRGAPPMPSNVESIEGKLAAQGRLSVA